MTEENRSTEPNGKDTKREEMTRTVKFVLFSISAGAIEMASFALLDALKVFDPTVCSIIALVLSVIWNFTLNREFTFRSANNVPVAMLKVAVYYAVFTPVTTILGNYLEGTCGWNGLLVTLLNMAVNFITEYLYDRFVVFGKSIDTNSRAQAKGKDKP